MEPVDVPPVRARASKSNKEKAHSKRLVQDGATFAEWHKCANPTPLALIYPQALARTCMRAAALLSAGLLAPLVEIPGLCDLDNVHNWACGKIARLALYGFGVEKVVVKYASCSYGHGARDDSRVLMSNHVNKTVDEWVLTAALAQHCAFVSDQKTGSSRRHFSHTKFMRLMTGIGGARVKRRTTRVIFPEGGPGDGTSLLQLDPNVVAKVAAICREGGVHRVRAACIDYGRGLGRFAIPDGALPNVRSVILWLVRLLSSPAIEVGVTISETFEWPPGDFEGTEGDLWEEMLSRTGLRPSVYNKKHRMTDLRSNSVQFVHVASTVVYRITITKLRQEFQKEWMRVLGTGRGCSAEAFNAWLFEAMASSRKKTSRHIGVKPGGEATAQLWESHPPIPSESVLKFLLAIYPTPGLAGMTAGDTMTNLRKYLASCTAVVSGAPQEVCDGVEGAIKALEEKLTKGAYSSAQGNRDAVTDIRNLLFPALEPLFRDRVEEMSLVCAQMFNNAASTYWESLCNTASDRISGVVMRCERNDFDGRGERVEYALKMQLGCGQMRAYVINKDVDTRLTQQYSDSAISRTGHDNEVSCEVAIFAMLHRYHTLFGPSSEGHGWQMAVPSAVMHFLTTEFGVNTELFASPLNRNPYLKHFCSLFPDTDRYFGSLGNFFALPLCFFAEGGSFEANPPFEEAVINRMWSRIQVILSSVNAAHVALSFIIILPQWDHMEALGDIRKSLWLTHEEYVPSVYDSGVQHIAKDKHRVIRCDGRFSSIFWIQTPAGNRKWPPTASRIEDMLNIWKSV